MTRNAYTIVAVLVTAVLLIAGCSAAPRGMTGYDSAPGAPAEQPDMEMEEERAAREEFGDTGGVPGEIVEQRQIKNGEITLEVPSPEDTMTEIVEIVESRGGYVSDSSLQQQQDQRPRINMTVRVPEAEFDSLTAELHRMGVVTRSRTWIDDVTEEYIDLRARLNNLESEEEALRQILERAETVEDMLAVRRQLNDVRGQIDSLSGRLRYLDDRISYSTYRISIQPEGLATTAIKTTGFDGFGSRIVTAFIRGANWVLNNIAAAILALTIAVPALVVIAILFSLGLLVYRRWGSKLF